MSYTYDKRKRPQGQTGTEPGRTAAPVPGMEALMSGRAAPTAAQKGQPFDLDAAMKAKMENAFGDLSAVKFYKSRAVGDAGAEAIAQGNEIAFAPGKADFSTRSGQERLGHELSHVMSQRSGQVRGSGFLNDSSLEARADREGAMAAAGQQVYAGPVTHALSGAVPSAFSAGTMQARRDVDRAERIGSSMLLDRDLQKLYENSEKKPNKFVSKKDKLWFQNKMKSGDEGFFKEIRKRRNAAAERLAKHREAMGQGPNDQLLDYEASFSVPAQETRLYDLMLGKGSEDTASPLENTKEGALTRNKLLNPKLRYLLLKSAGWNKEANKLLSDAGKTYRLRHGDLQEYPLNDAYVNTEKITGPGEKPTDSELMKHVDLLVRIQAAITGHENEIVFAQDEKVPELKEKYLAQGMDEDEARLAAKKEVEESVDIEEYLPNHKDTLKWYNEQVAAGTEADYEEALRRELEEKMKLVAYRKQLGEDHPNEAKEVLDLHAHYSDHGMKYMVLNNLVKQLGMGISKPLDLRGINLKYIEAASPHEHELEPMNDVLGAPGKASDFLDTNLGKKRSQFYRKRSKDYLRDLYINYATV